MGIEANAHTLHKNVDGTPKDLKPLSTPATYAPYPLRSSLLNPMPVSA